MKFRIFDDHVLMYLGSVPITETMVTSTAVTCGLVIIAVWARALVRRNPSHWLAVLAMVTVRWLDNLVQEVIGRPQPVVSTLSGSLFLFIACCNLAGQLPGVHPATASLATTSALAVIVFLAVPVAGIASKGVMGYLRHYFRPNPLLMPLHVISEISRTLALSVRLFGNIMSGHLVVALMVALTGFLVATPLMALDLLIGLLQAYVFTILATVYVGAAISSGED